VRTPGRALEKGVALALITTAVASAGALIALRLHFQPPRVPAYVASAANGVLTLDPHSEFRLVLRPVTHVDGAVGARAFLVRGESVRPWDPPFDVTREGVVTIAGPVDVLFHDVPPGAWDVAVAVGRPEVLPTAPRDVLRERDRDRGADAAFRVAVVHVRLTASAR
jgi:hypothetical protein